MKKKYKNDIPMIRKHSINNSKNLKNDHDLDDCIQWLEKNQYQKESDYTSLALQALQAQFQLKITYCHVKLALLSIETNKELTEFFNSISKKLSNFSVITTQLIEQVQKNHITLERQISKYLSSVNVDTKVKKQSNDLKKLMSQCDKGDELIKKEFTYSNSSLNKFSANLSKKKIKFNEYVEFIKGFNHFEPRTQQFNKKFFNKFDEIEENVNTCKSQLMKQKQIIEGQIETLKIDQMKYQKINSTIEKINSVEQDYQDICCPRLLLWKRKSQFSVEKNKKWIVFSFFWTVFAGIAVAGIPFYDSDFKASMNNIYHRHAAHSTLYNFKFELAGGLGTFIVLFCMSRGLKIYCSKDAEFDQLLAIENGAYLQAHCNNTTDNEVKNDLYTNL